MGIKINYHTKISGVKTVPVQKAADNLIRDLKKVFLNTDEPGVEIRLAEGAQEVEKSLIQVRNGAWKYRRQTILDLFTDFMRSAGRCLA